MNTVNTKSYKKKDSTLGEEILSWIYVIALASVIAFVLNTFIIANSKVPTGSMENTIMAGDRVIGFRLNYLFEEPSRGDIIIFRYPDNEDIYYVKRIIGMPGETVKITDRKVYINSELLTEDYLKEEMYPQQDMTFEVPEGAYFVMGDNRNNSLDARFWKNTYVYKDKIIAKVLFRYFPNITWLDK